MKPLAERQSSHTQTSTSTTTDSYDWPTPYVRALLQAEPSQLRAMTQTPTACATALSAIDNEIDMANRLTLSLFSRRNALAPISALPSELLARIFHFHSLVDPPGLYGRRYKGWIAVTHVCQRWRQVALEDSSLWARISGPSQSSKWFMETQVRARNMPLVIDLQHVPETEIVAKILPHVSHIRELRLRSMYLIHYKGVAEIFGLEAPLLEHLEIGFSGHRPAIFRHSSGTALFNGRAPNLRTIILNEAFIHWSLIPRCQLIQLKITLPKRISTADSSDDDSEILDIPSPIPSSDDVIQLLDLLINCSELEVLVLKFCLPDMLSQLSYGPFINFPHLSHLCLGGSTSCITNLLKMLTLPSSATLRIRCVPEDLPTESVDILLSLVAAHFYNSSPVGFKRFSVTASSSQHLVEVTASNALHKSTSSRPCVLEDGLESGAELTLSFEEVYLSRTSSYATILGRICSILPVSNVEVLSISARETIQSVNWYELFQDCKEVIAIQVKGRATSSLLQSLAPLEPTNVLSGDETKNGGDGRDDSAAHAPAQVDNDDAGSSHAALTPTPTTPFPKLASLSLENVNFNDIVPSSEALYDIFVDALRRRKTSGSPLSKLTVNACNITAEWANNLKQQVTEFNWDGDEGPYDPWEDYDYSLDDICFSPPRENIVPPDEWYDNYYG